MWFRPDNKITFQIAIHFVLYTEAWINNYCKYVFQLPKETALLLNESNSDKLFALSGNFSYFCRISKKIFKSEVVKSNFLMWTNSVSPREKSSK